ncbi:hypothetical protein HPB49_004666 [Dermacentor silvarum]|uniref:Uncharacterized protein n=1 Tax=Dermacentor silvarum TaxID=543639 RepID=A0ACB8C237_DERSI|nr:hypothetical protein HPB49_004666 [Dermacentor silvarum]
MDADQRTAWTRAIPRKDFAPIKYTVVCEKHFLTSDFVTTSTYRDEKTGRVLEVPLQLRRLKSGAIPSLFPNCPSYLSRPTTVVREGPEEKRLRLEGESLQEAIRQSVEAHEEEKKKNNISTFEDLLTALTSFQTNTFWTKLVTHDKVLFLNFNSQEAPTVRFSVTVSADLTVKVFVGDVQLNKLGTLVLPVCLCDLREIDKVLTAVQSLAGNFSNSEERLQIVLKKTVETLDELASQSFPHEWQVEVVNWLDYWKSLKHDTGHFTHETHNALRHTSLALVEVTSYCLKELGFKYVLLGKFQSDCLEDRFGRYRQLSGAQYHISIRQMYEAEHKLRLQKVLELPESDEIPLCASTDEFRDALKQFQIVVGEEDIAAKQHTLPAITYVAGYCAYAALKKLTCAFCQENLLVESKTVTIEADEFITSITRGGLKFPQAVVVNAVLIMNIVLEKLTTQNVWIICRSLTESAMQKKIKLCHVDLIKLDAQDCLADAIL